MSMSSYIQTFFPDYVNSDMDFWSKNSSVNVSYFKKIKKRFKEISVIRSISKKNLIFNEFVNEIIQELILNAKYNLRIDNIPDKDENNCIIDDDKIYSTFSDWGKIYIFRKYKSSIFVWFFNDSDAQVAHQNLNQMQIIDNIIITHYQPQIY